MQNIKKGDIVTVEFVAIQEKEDGGWISGQGVAVKLLVPTTKILSVVSPIKAGDVFKGVNSGYTFTVLYADEKGLMYENGAGARTCTHLKAFPPRQFTHERS